MQEFLVDEKDGATVSYAFSHRICSGKFRIGSVKEKKIEKLYYLIFHDSFHTIKCIKSSCVAYLLTVGTFLFNVVWFQISMSNNFRAPASILKM